MTPPREQIHPRTPVLVGVGERSERLGDAGYRALSPADLAGQAARAALTDAATAAPTDASREATVRALADAINVVACVRLFEDCGLEEATQLGRSTNLPRSVAARISAHPARAVLETGGGQSPQHLVTEFAAAIAAGRAEAVVIAGAEALSTARHYRDAPEHTRPRWSEGPAGDLEDRGPGLGDMTSPDKAAVGLVGATAAYALFESARRARLGLSRRDYALEMGRLFAPFTRVAAADPHAAAPTARTAEELTEVSVRNRLVAEPYPRFLVARDQVNQGAAVLLTTYARAQEAGIPARRLVFLAGHADAVEQPLLRRPDLASSPASMAALRLALEVAGITTQDLATIDLYSCFPIAVTNAADGIGLAYDDPRGLTLTGGLPFFGGPGNNYALHAIVRTVQRLRDVQAGRASAGASAADAAAPPYGLVTANGGIMSSYSVGIYTTQPTPWREGRSARLQAEMRGWAGAPTTGAPEGRCTIAGYTVAWDRAGGRLGLLVGETLDGERFLARAADDPATWALLASEQPVGAVVEVAVDAAGVPLARAPLEAAGPGASGGSRGLDGPSR